MLTNSAYTHTHEFDTRKLNPTQTRILRIEQYIYEHYKTRYNEVIHIMEYRKKQPGVNVHETEPYRILDEMMENSIWAEANERGLACHVGTIQNLIYSNFSISYHPIREYFDNLPAWDGIDYIRILADSAQTTHQDFWIECLKRYLVAMCAAAMNDDIVNHTVLLLCSEIQNIGKTTFINNLLPPELRMYLSTGLINPNNKDDLAKVAQAMLISEFPAHRLFRGYMQRSGDTSRHDRQPPFSLFSRQFDDIYRHQLRSDVCPDKVPAQPTRLSVLVYPS